MEPVMWEVIIRPHEQGVVVSISDGKTISLVGRVGRNRWRTAKPWRTFKGALFAVIARAEEQAWEANHPCSSVPTATTNG